MLFGLERKSLDIEMHLDYFYFTRLKVTLETAVLCHIVYDTDHPIIKIGQEI